MSGKNCQNTKHVKTKRTFRNDENMLGDVLFFVIKQAKKEGTKYFEKTTRLSSKIVFLSGSLFCNEIIHQ